MRPEPDCQLSPEVARLVKEALEAILRLSRVKPHLVVLFGSEARGEATSESDIDLLVVLETVDSKAVRDIRGAIYDVMWKCDFCRLVSVVTLSQHDFEEQRRKGFSFAQNIERDGVVLWQAA